MSMRYVATKVKTATLIAILRYPFWLMIKTQINQNATFTLSKMWSKTFIF